MKLLLTLVFLVSLCVASFTASAQDISGIPDQSNSAPENGAPALGKHGAFFTGLEHIATQVASRVNSGVNSGLFEQGLTIGMGLKTTALSFGGALALVYLLFEAFKSFSGKGDPLMNVLMDIGLPVMVAAVLINNYDTHMRNFALFLNEIASHGGNPIQGVVTFFSSALGMIGSALNQAISNFFKMNSFYQMLGATLDLLAVVLFCIPMIYIVIAGLAEIAAVILLGPFLFAVGAAFGPIFIVTIVTPWTKDYFGKWLGFLVGSAMVTGVTGVAIQIASTVFSNMHFNDLTSPGEPVALSLGIGAILLMSVNSILGQIPGIASALVPGTIGVRSDSSAIRQATQSVMDKNKRAAGGVMGTGKLTQRIGSAALGKILGKPHPSSGGAPLPTINMK